MRCIQYPEIPRTSIHCPLEFKCAFDFKDFQSVIINPEPEIGDKFSGALRTPNHKISDFYHWNQIETFTYDKPFQHPHKDKENEFRVRHPSL